MKAYSKLKEGRVVDIEYGRLKDGTEIFRNASSRAVEVDPRNAFNSD
jgi:hypothetical protein